MNFHECCDLTKKVYLIIQTSKYYLVIILYQWCYFAFFQLTLLNAGRKYLGLNSLSGKVFLTSGLGGMSGAQAKASYKIVVEQKMVDKLGTTIFIFVVPILFSGCRDLWMYWNSGWNELWGLEKEIRSGMGSGNDRWRRNSYYKSHKSQEK